MLDDRMAVPLRQKPESCYLQFDHSRTLLWAEGNSPASRCQTIPQPPLPGTLAAALVAAILGCKRSDRHFDPFRQSAW